MCPLIYKIKLPAVNTLVRYYIVRAVKYIIYLSVFQRLGKVVEDRKSFAIATSEENKPKNRYDFVLPYDSNRVILAPLATRPSSTYINASFVTVSTNAFAQLLYSSS